MIACLQFRLGIQALLLLLLCSSVQLAAREKPGQNHFQPQFSPNPLQTVQTLWNVNNIGGWVRSDGWSGRNPLTGSSGVIYPRFTAAFTFQDGIIWGGIVRDTRDPNLPRMRVGGQTYLVGTQPGWIVQPGTPTTPPVPINPLDPRVQIYRIRSDWQNLTVTDPVVIRDAAESFNVDTTQVTTAMAQQIIDQYAADWNNWPGDLGAPFYDRNGNGIWDAGIDEPGLQNADQVLWFAINDLDAGLTTGLYGSPPIGLEVQITMWGFQTGGALQQTSFHRYRIINKSGFRIDSMFVAQWADVDLGDFADDFVGCDRNLDAAFVYNGNAIDNQYSAFGLPPAAGAYDLLQGAIVPSPGDTAWFDFRRIPDHRNLPMTSFGYFAAGSSFGDPEFGVYNGTLEWYNLLNGFEATTDTTNPFPFVTGCGANQGTPTKFPLSGDPVLGIGDVDGCGFNFPPGERRMALCNGPFTMINGDTQEVVFAVSGGIVPGGDHLSSVSQLKEQLRFIRSQYGDTMEIPQITYRTSHPAAITTEFGVTADLRQFSGVSTVDFTLVPQIGSDPILSLNLWDDGLHNDSLPGDNIWGSTTALINRKFPHRGDLDVVTATGSRNFPAIVTGITLRPLPELLNRRIVWENGPQDSSLNNLETVRQRFDVHNPDLINSIDELEFYNLEAQARGQIVHFQTSLLPGATAGDSAFNFLLFGPAQGDSLTHTYRVRFDHNTRVLSQRIPVVAWAPPPVWGDTLPVTSIRGSIEHVAPVVADPALLNGHSYLLMFRSGIDTTQLRWRLLDVTANVIRVENGQVSNDPLFPFPVVDGVQYRVSFGEPGMRDWQIPAGTRRFTWANADGFGWEGFNGAIGWGSPAGPNGFGTGGFPEPVAATELKNTLLILAQVDAGGVLYDPPFNPADPNMSFAYRYGRGFANPPARPEFAPHIVNPSGGYAYQDFVKSVPLSAWDVEDPGNPRRLELGYLENNAINALVDGKYWPSDASLDNIAASGPREWLWVYETDYSETPNPAWQHDALSTPLPVMWWSMANRNGPVPFSPGGTGEDQFLIIKSALNVPGDSLLVVATPTGLAGDDHSPLNTFSLSQNFPNPFNPSTTIRFSLARNVEVTLLIFNILGQKVRTLLHEPMTAGIHRVTWDGTNSAGRQVASGLYFYRLKAGTFVKTRKMILLR